MNSPEEKMPSPGEVLSNYELFARYFLKIVDKETHNLIPFVLNRAQKERNRRRTHRDLILKYRQGGFTTNEQAMIFWKSITRTSSTLALTHDDTTTALARRLQDTFYDSCKFGTIQPKRDYNNATLTTYPELHSEVMLGKAGSVQIGRGANLTTFIGDEIAFWENPSKIIAGALQAGNPDATLLSTANGAQGYFFELCQEAASGKSVWNLMFFPWWYEDLYRMPVTEPLVYDEEEKLLVKQHNLTQEQMAWRRYKQLELKEFFKQEFPEDFYSAFIVSGEGYFGNIDGVFTAPQGAEWQPDHRYTAGLDFGQSADFTDLVVIDKTAKCQVDYLHVNKLEWAEIRKRVADMYFKWKRFRCPKGHLLQGNVIKCTECGSHELEPLGLKTIVAEKNAMGQVNIESLRSLGVSVEGVTTDNNTKREMLSFLNEALHAGGLKLLNIPVIQQEFKSFISKQTSTGLWTAMAVKGGHDDAVMAASFANFAIVPQIFLYDE